ncbi:MAG: helix-turn-helix domain-containing protein [Nanoarchaeota archaeon]|nr:helix-turn-helix domain-containing protein [Nanoarchaeota archaeon]MBU1269049.1 helix-turn-helix domain-containing protein [Nanoarchaeota archaeon]MBU1603752.1 helix-turn-helix domain-containing protein [Nanoarchaeota archaeon]MBU2443523.1 helix-turn-helix domain-containing protein [Nanoarchaeota archaeon]
MWVVKIIIPANEGMLVGSRTKKYNVTVMGYPLSHFIKEEILHVLVSIHLIGDSLSKKKFLQDLKKDKRTIKIDMTNDSFGFGLIQQHSGMKAIFNHKIIYVKPIIISNDGEYIFEMASWEKERLMEFVKVAQTKIYGGRLVSITQKKIENIAITSILPKLTEKQSRAMELAIENEYYGYPRKVEIKQLADMMKVSYSTYQFHLRNAEKKLMPYFYSNTK